MTNNISGQYTFTTSLSPEKVNNIIGNEVNGFMNNSVWANTSWNSSYNSYSSYSGGGGFFSSLGNAFKNTFSQMGQAFLYGAIGGIFQNIFGGLFGGVAGNNNTYMNYNAANLGAVSATQAASVATATTLTGDLSGYTSDQLLSLLTENNKQISEHKRDIKSIEAKLASGTDAAKTKIDELKGKLSDTQKLIYNNIANIRKQDDIIVLCDSNIADAREAKSSATLNLSTTNKAIEQLTQQINIEPDADKKAAKQELLESYKQDKERLEREIADADRTIQDETRRKSDAQAEKTKLEQELNKSQEDYKKAEEVIKAEDAYATYSKEETRTKLDAELQGLRTNLEKLETANANIKFYYEQALLREGAVQTKRNNMAQQFAANDPIDGNWWQRNMPRWLGGAKSADKARMRTAHTLRNEATSYFGGTSAAMTAVNETYLLSKYSTGHFSTWKNASGVGLTSEQFIALTSKLGGSPNDILIRNKLRQAGYSESA